MKKILAYVAALGLLMLSPVEEADVGRLHPVEVVMISRDGDEIVMMTDTGDRGKGSDGLNALEDLKKTTPGTIYLDTAQYLLIGEGAEDVVEQLRSVLKKLVRVCKAENEVDLRDAAAYLSVHGDLPQLEVWKMGVDLPKLTVVEKRLKIL